MDFLKKIKNSNEAGKASIAYTICNILQKSISFLTLPLFTRLLTKEQYGQYSIYATWSAIFSILITLNLAYGSFDKAMIEYEDDKDGYASSLHGIVFILTIVFIGIYLPLSKWINSFISLPTPIILVMIGEIVCNFAIQIWCGKQKFAYKWKSVVFVTLLLSIISPIVALLLVINTQEKGYSRIYGYALVTILIGLFFIVYNIIRGKKIFSKKYWSYALSYNIVLLPYYFSQMIFNQSDRIMIEKMTSIEKSGVYSVAYSFALILTFVVNAINSAYVPWMYRKIKNKDKKNSVNISLLISVIIGTLISGIIWIAPEVIKIMAGDDYLEAIYVIPPIALSLILLLYSQFYINIEFYYGMKFRMVIASIGAAAINIGLNYWLIPIYGYYAAGYTTLISYIVFALSNYSCVHRLLNKNGELKGFYNNKYLIILFILFGALSYVGVLLYGYWIVRYSIIVLVILALVILFIIYRNKIKDLFEKKSISKVEVENNENSR